MDLRLPLLAAICLLAGAQAAPLEQVLFDGALRPGWTLAAWGGTNRADVVKDEAAGGEAFIRMRFASDAPYGGGFLSGASPIDLSQQRTDSLLTFRVRGAVGGEGFSVVLRDGSEKDGQDGYVASVNSEDYVPVTTDWQTVQIPLRDFPNTGLNWTLPPLDQLPHQRPIDWHRVNMLGFYKHDRAAVIDVDRITIGPQVAGQGKLGLVTPLAVSGSVDFSRGEQVAMSARFSGLADWRIEVAQGQASRAFQGRSYAVNERWDGLADTGEFGPGAANVVLLYRQPGSQDAWDRAEATVVVKGAHSPQVQVNQVGYLPQTGKVAYVTGLDLPRDFVAKSTDGKVAMKGRTTPPEFYEFAGERVARIDLSELTAPGTYVVEVDGVGRSFPFRIGNGVYDDLLRATMKSYYYQRCGTDLAEPYAGVWTHRACHTDDAYVYAGYSDGRIVSGEHVASTGGWHDAGDYGKKIVPAAAALSYLLRLAEMFPEKIGAVPVNVPGDERLPGYLREVKYELDWFLTMQRPDGAVYHLITSAEFFAHDMPEKDAQRRYLVPVSTCATADFAAVMAVAGRVYRDHDAAFAARCLDASRRAWGYVSEHPDIVPPGGYADPKGINGTGTYGDKDDRDERFWAACELYVATGEGRFLDYVRANYGNWKPLFGGAPGWMDTHLYGVYSFVLADGVDEKLKSLFRAELVAQADRMVGVVRASPYSMTIDVEENWWNNATILEYGAQLLLAHAVTGEKDYADCALLQMGYVLGCNPMDYCYVSGFGTKSTKDIWQGASANDGIDAPVPGFVVPGPGLVAWDTRMSAYRELNNLPVMKTYQDDHAAYSVNEVCLTFNAPMVFSAGYLVLHGESAAH